MTRQELLKRYSILQASLKSKMLSLAMSKKQEKAVKAEMKKISKKLHNSILKHNQSWSATTLPDYYATGAAGLIGGVGKEGRQKLKQAGILNAKSAKVKQRGLKQGALAEKAMKGVVREGNSSIQKQFEALLKLKKGFSTDILKDPEVLKRTSAAIKAFGIADAKANNLARSNSFEKVVRGILGDRNGAYMFLDKSGRRWSYKRWSQMVTRSYQDQTRRNGFLATAKEIKEDLAKIIDHPDESDSCRPYENMIISLTGETPGFPTYDELQGNDDHIFTPTCRHQLRILSLSEKKNL